MYPEFVNLRNFEGEYANVLMQRRQYPFWKDVLKHYKKFYSKCSPTDTSEFVSESIHYNIKIIRGKRVIFFKEWMDSDIFLIGHL